MKDVIRTFIAIEIGSQIMQALDSYITNFQPEFSRGFKWVKPKNLHLTLKFLGETSPKMVIEIKKILDEIVTCHSSFALEVGGTGAFPSWSRLRTVWVGIQESQSLNSLYGLLDDRVSRLGFASEGKKFSPHLTICRVAEYCDPKLITQLKNEIQAHPFPGLYKTTITDLIFFKSVLQPSGPTYTPISKHPLS